MAKPKQSANTENDELIKLVDERMDDGTDWRVFRQVQINRSFYEGRQWISWNDTNKRVYEPPLRRGEIRYTYNKIKPAVTTLLAKLTKNRVQLDVAPDSNDENRIEIAKAGVKYLKNQWQEQLMDYKSQRLKFYMLVDGFPALKVYADPNQGDEIDTSELDEEVTEGDTKKPSKTLRTGKICTIVVDELSLRVDLTAKDPDDFKWAMEIRPRNVDDIEEEYDVEVQPEENIEIGRLYDPSSGNSSDTSKKYKNTAMVKEYWEKPSKKFPNGRKITVANKQLLDYNKDPGEFPFIFFPMTPVPDRAIADGIVKDMTTPQRSFNVKRTAEARILEEMGNPMWMKPKGSVDDAEDITNEIGGILEFMPINGSEPKRVPGVEPGNGWQAAMDRDEKDMSDISGAHDVSQGQAPSQVDTFGGMQLLIEQDETKLALAAHSYERGIKRWGELVLALVKKHFPEEQQLKIVGENGEIEAFTFSGEDLTGEEVVDVIPNSSMPVSQTAKEQKIFQMYEAGMFTDPKTGMPDTRKVTRLLGQSIATAYFDDTEQDENKAKMENRAWQKAFEDKQMQQPLMDYAQQAMVYQEMSTQAQQAGTTAEDLGFPKPQPPVKLPAVRDFYDHQTHLENHNRYRKTDDYDQLPPELQMIVDQHCSEHEQALQAPMMEQQQQQMQMQQAQMDQQGQIQQQQTQAEAVKAQADQQRTEAQMAHQANMKAMDHKHGMEKANVQANAALLQAAFKQPTGQG